MALAALSKLQAGWGPVPVALPVAWLVNVVAMAATKIRDVNRALVLDAPEISGLLRGGKHLLKEFITRAITDSDTFYILSSLSSNDDRLIKGKNHKRVQLACTFSSITGPNFIDVYLDENERENHKLSPEELRIVMDAWLHRKPKWDSRIYAWRMSDVQISGGKQRR